VVIVIMYGRIFAGNTAGASSRPRLML